MSTLSLTRQKEIDQVIENFKLKTGLSYPENSLIQIAKAVGIDVFSIDLEDYANDVDGIIKYEGDDKDKKPKIYINKSFPDKRKLFTLAHELGHYFLHPSKEKMRIDTFHYAENSQESVEETEANYFAAAILVPKEKLLRLFSLPGISITDVADYFHVSLPVIQTRLKWLKTNK